MPVITSADGVRLSYEIEGDGPPLQLHLGAGCDSDLWRAAGYLGPLSRQYRCILFDHRGHGKSDHPRGAAANHVDRFAADVVVLLDHLAIPSSAMWAYSNGIAVGLTVAQDHPPRVQCLIGSGVIGRAQGEQLAQAVARSIAQYRDIGWEKLISGFEHDEGPVPVWMKERIRATDLGPVMDWAEARLSWGWSSWEALGRVAAPTLFLVGELEDPDDTMAGAAAEMQHGSRVRVPQKGHINAFLDSAFVLPHVEEFLAVTRSG